MASERCSVKLDGGLSSVEETPSHSQDSTMMEDMERNSNGCKQDDLVSHVIELSRPEGNLTQPSNRVLEEVLNEKKVALLRSPEVIRFLQEKQLASKLKS